MVMGTLSAGVPRPGLLLAPFLIAKITALRKDEQASARTARYSPKQTKENVVASNLMPTSK